MTTGNVLVSREWLERAIESLKFYADSENYKTTWVSGGCSCCDAVELPAPIENDKGEEARYALRIPNFISTDRDLDVVYNALKKHNVNWKLALRISPEIVSAFVLEEQDATR